MTKKTMLVCGGTGFLGHNIAERFANHPGYEVHATCFQRPSWHHPNITWHQIDLCNGAMVGMLMNHMDIVVQAAAVTSGCKDTFERPYLHVTDNAVMNSYIFRHAFEKKAKHVIWFSCSTMYGGGFVNEQAPIAPNPRYFGMVGTKLYLEKMAAFYAGLGDTKFTVVRGSNFYGPHDKFALDKAHVFGATINKVMSATHMVDVWGDGSEARDVMYIDDLVNFVECAIEKQPDNFGLYNCGAGHAATIGDLVAKIIKVSGKDLAVKYDVDKPSIKVSTSLNCALAHSQLEWTPKVSLEDGITSTILWYEAHKHEFL